MYYIMNRDKNLMLILCNIIAFLLNLKHVCRLSSSSGCGGSTKSSSKSSNESKDPCVNAFDFKFGSKISLRGPETVRKTHSSTSTSSTSSTSSNSCSSCCSSSRSSRSRRSSSRLVVVD